MLVLCLILVFEQQLIECHSIEDNSTKNVSSSCTPYKVTSTVISVVFIDIKKLLQVSITNINCNFRKN